MPMVLFSYTLHEQPGNGLFQLLWEIPHNLVAVPALLQKRGDGCIGHL